MHYFVGAGPGVKIPFLRGVGWGWGGLFYCVIFSISQIICGWGSKNLIQGGGGVQPQHPVPMNAYKPALCTGNKEQVHVKPVSTTFTKGTYCGKN
jgi:hypothetical protein